MQRDDIMKKLQQIFVDVFDDEDIQINEHTNANDIEEWDSLTNINILAAVQDEFEVSFEIDEIVTMNNVSDMIDAIIGKM